MTRGRPPAITPSRSINTHLEENLMVRLDLFLWSDLEGKVPKGAYQRFFNERMREFFLTQSLDIAPLLGGLTPSIVRGTAATLGELKERLESE